MQPLLEKCCKIAIYPTDIDSDVVVFVTFGGIKTLDGAVALFFICKLGHNQSAFITFIVTH